MVTAPHGATLLIFQQKEVVIHSLDYRRVAVDPLTLTLRLPSFPVSHLTKDLGTGATSCNSNGRYTAPGHHPRDLY